MSDEDLIALGRREVAALGLVSAEQVLDGCVIRMAKAYPVYDDHYRVRISTIRDHLERVASNLQVIGRNGQHRYNNQDHSMLTAIYAARNIRGVKEAGCNQPYDVWHVNTTKEYHEEGANTVRPTADSEPVTRQPDDAAIDPRVAALLESLARFDPIALGISGFINLGMLMFLATAVLLIKGGPEVGPNLELLANYFLGFRVTWFGAFVGLLEGGAAGFVLGWTIASLMNLLTSSYERQLVQLAKLQNALELAVGD